MEFRLDKGKSDLIWFIATGSFTYTTSRPITGLLVVFPLPISCWCSPGWKASLESVFFCEQCEPCYLDHGTSRHEQHFVIFDQKNGAAAFRFGNLPSTLRKPGQGFG